MSLLVFGNGNPRSYGVQRERIRINHIAKVAVLFSIPLTMQADSPPTVFQPNNLVKSSEINGNFSKAFELIEGNTDDISTLYSSDYLKTGNITMVGKLGIAGSELSDLPGLLNIRHTGTLAGNSHDVANSALLVSNGAGAQLAFDANEIRGFGAPLWITGQDGLNLGVGDEADSSALPNALSITSSGKVGIGVSDPLTPLHLPLAGLQIGDSDESRDNFHIVSDDWASRALRFYNGDYGTGGTLLSLFPGGDATLSGKLYLEGGVLSLHNTDSSGGASDISGIKAWNGLALYSTCCGYQSAADYGILLQPRDGSAIFKGRVGIGTTTPSQNAMLDVNGPIYQRGSQLHADHVFKRDYKLESIETHAAEMWKNGHLPAVPAAQKDDQGLDVVDVGARSRGALEELEKAHIYIEQLNRKNRALENRLERLERQLQLYAAAPEQRRIVESGETRKDK